VGEGRGADASPFRSKFEKAPAHPASHKLASAGTRYPCLHPFNTLISVEADQLSLTQAQIKQFVRRYPDWLKKGRNGTFFLFKVGSEFFKILPNYSQNHTIGC
jgi:hypothetical protein